MNAPQTINAGSLSKFRKNATRPIRIHNTSGNAATVTGEIYDSNIMPGRIAVETDFGLLYLPHGQRITVSEAADDLPADDLYAINDALTSLLGSFGWNAQSNTDDEQLDTLTYLVASKISTLVTSADQ